MPRGVPKSGFRKRSKKEQPAPPTIKKNLKAAADSIKFKSQAQAELRVVVMNTLHNELIRQNLCLVRHDGGLVYANKHDFDSLVNAGIAGNTEKVIEMSRKILGNPADNGFTPEDEQKLKDLLKKKKAAVTSEVAAVSL